MKNDATRALSREMLTFHCLYREHISRRFSTTAPGGLSQAEALVMYILADQRRLPMSQLIERTQMPKQQITKLVNQLEEKQLVVRTRPSENRRIVILEPTEAAYAIQRQALMDAETQLESVFSQLETDALEEFLAALRTINRILDRFPPGMDAAPIRKELP